MTREDLRKLKKLIFNVDHSLWNIERTTSDLLYPNPCEFNTEEPDEEDFVPPQVTPDDGLPGWYLEIIVEMLGTNIMEAQEAVKRALNYIWVLDKDLAEFEELDDELDALAEGDWRNYDGDS